MEANAAFRAVFRFFAGSRSRLLRFLDLIRQRLQHLDCLGRPLLNQLLKLHLDVQMSAAPLGFDTTDAASQWSPEKYEKEIFDNASFEKSSHAEICTKLKELCEEYGKIHPDADRQKLEQLLSSFVPAQDITGPMCMSPTTAPIEDHTAAALLSPTLEEKEITLTSLENRKRTLELSQVMTSKNQPIITYPIYSSE